MMGFAMEFFLIDGINNNNNNNSILVLAVVRKFDLVIGVDYKSLKFLDFWIRRPLQKGYVHPKPLPSPKSSVSKMDAGDMCVCGS
jgi:hypothetical protein